jgi:hypothetical protein
MHPLIGLLILLGAAAFIGFAFRQGMGVRRDRRSDDGAAMNIGGSDSGASHHPGDGPGHGF